MKFKFNWYHIDLSQRMGIIFTKPWLKVLSGLFTNLAAGWFGAVFIVPAFADTTHLSGIIVLIRYLLSGIISLLISVKIEEILER
ncbi:hypothetical protein A2769_01140 [Candidatus Daviesbacteria bacterium RIFCSPHIGHO2_01_FULL_37_27]|nr:MAG: hypothetical protein A2769_01140 [Candidatus Daviesbacteria bacterium RIFCSPHIGHO2_01_FULL_37_27]